MVPPEEAVSNFKAAKLLLQSGSALTAVPSARSPLITSSAASSLLCKPTMNGVANFDGVDRWPLSAG